MSDLRQMLEALPGTRVGLRDRALLLLGFAGAFRRSELVSLDVSDLEFSQAGLIVTLRKSKTDQEGKSRRIGIPFGSSEATCPVRSLQAWLESARIVDGAIFRSLDTFQRVQPSRLSDKAVALIVKRRAKAVGLDPTRYAGHSLRPGWPLAPRRQAPANASSWLRPSLRRYGPPLHPRWQSLARKRGRDRGLIVGASTLQTRCSPYSGACVFIPLQLHATQ